MMLRLRARGFTLIEVILALAVFALAFGLILETMGAASQNARLADQLGRVALLAQNELDAIGVDAPVQVGARNGEFDDNYRYEINIQPYVPEDSTVPETTQIKLYRIDLDVSWGNGGNVRTERFSTIKSVQKQLGER
jgi:general secretion pathway protein I